MNINRVLLQSVTSVLVMFSLVGCGGATSKPATSPTYSSILAESPTSTRVSNAPSATRSVLPSPSPTTNTPISTSPTATFTTEPTPTRSAWPAADPNSLPDEDLVLYSEGNKLKSSPHRRVFDRPEINPIHNQESEHFDMFMYVLTSGPVASPDGRYVVLKAQGQEPPPPAPPTWLIDVESGQMRKLEVKGHEAAGVGPVTWSPDGCCLTFIVEDTLYVYDVQSDAEPVPIFSQPGLKSFFARWSPTGEWIAVASDANPQDIVSAEREYIYWLISPEGSVIRNLGQYPIGGYGVVPYNMDWSPDGRLLLTPSQLIISWYESVVAADSATYNPTDPARWLPRAWTRSFLSQQLAESEHPSLYTWALSPSGRQIAYSLYDDAAQQSELYIFDRSTNSQRRMGVVSGYIINDIRWTGREEFLVLGLGDPIRSVEGGPVVLQFDAQEAGPPQVLVKGEDLYLIDVIPNHLVAGAAPTPTPGPTRPLATPVPMKTGPVVDIPGSPYSVIELSILDPPACCLAAAPDGERHAFATCRTMAQKVYVQNVDGSGLKEISSLRIQDGDGPCPDPAWSPDSRQLVFANYDYSLYVVNADGTNLTRLVPEGFDPVWSPDGQQIAFTAHHAQKGVAIGVMNGDGNDFRLLTNSEGRDQRPAWSPDGQHIAFVSDRDGNQEIYVMNRDGSEQRRLTYHEAQDWGPVWSPDGRYIVFSSDRNGRNGLYAMNSDGTDQRWLMDTDAPARWPMDTTRVRFVEPTR
jgi:Tol biopolymer transport system component